MTAAKKVLKLAKYNVEVRDSQGVQVGDNNTMTLNFDK